MGFWFQILFSLNYNMPESELKSHSYKCKHRRIFMISSEYPFLGFILDSLHEIQKCRLMRYHKMQHCVQFSAPLPNNRTFSSYVTGSLYPLVTLTLLCNFLTSLAGDCYSYFLGVYKIHVTDYKWQFTFLWLISST